MLTISDIEELKKSLSVKRKESRHISLVPTMGNLHDGHLKLVKEASQISDFVCVSVFVNPLQFGPEEDFSSYPRTLDEDIQKLENTECALLFVPEPNELLLDIKTHTADPFLSSILCGKTRKNHFDGVVTIVNKLFELFDPDTTFFGEKDYQQLMIIKEFVSRQSLNVLVKGIPTEREDSGLAKSSRNQYLKDDEKDKATLIYKTLCQVKKSITDSASLDKAINEGIEVLEENSFKVDYLEARSKENLKRSNDLEMTILLCAATINKVRLIDNLVF
ncbi:pantoate--beta-alanine ligase [Gammaproteobacteria bacterium]|nr:pantoate--beta-alanine ligase [Gammaproteobacteria bacterium]MDC1251163.1 pantoate--beta-alanine ligase [Gammaproteobacteria bacterium]MDC3323239.1 pantoate--beta-alanine ligase [Gammaproteobacteria bacterium]|tara:strand:- start:1054 stop:1881 length:828 start_codon:yes stop_codon:yes gene_type:complete